MAGSDFVRELSRRQSDPANRRWLFVPYDQLNDAFGPLSREDPGSLGIIVIESPWKAGRRLYHKQKLALLLSNQRHFALEQAARGVAVHYAVAKGPYREARSTSSPQPSTQQQLVLVGPPGLEPGTSGL